MKILIVDDNKGITETLHDMLTLEGYEPVSTNCGCDGLKMIENGDFGAVMLDLQMPECSGFDVINSLEKSGKIKLNKIIVMTASEISSVELHELKKQGVQTWMRKPIDNSEILSMLRSFSPTWATN